MPEDELLIMHVPFRHCENGGQIDCCMHVPLLQTPSKHLVRSAIDEQLLFCVHIDPPVELVEEEPEEDPEEPPEEEEDEEIPEEDPEEPPEEEEDDEIPEEDPEEPPEEEEDEELLELEVVLV
ncbi:MAG: hypothetical protein HY094_10630 [Candidatus Melainabacteria bacterium]|nr:hypothetical protein [Candidatus Melainabacteria bacterium]